tara:strand:+ start:1023 stop:1493 length:471 start_codon:yes stop_codon:yes gene_type:complete
MATGDIKWFAQGLLDLGNKIHDMDGDDWRMGIVTTATVPSLSTAAPHWGGTGTTNFATNQVATGGTSYTGPKVLTTESWSLVSNVPTFRADTITMAIDASGFTNGAYGIIYNNTDANKRAVAFVEISSAGTASLVTGQLIIDWSGASNDILTLTQA